MKIQIVIITRWIPECTIPFCQHEFTPRFRKRVAELEAQLHGDEHFMTKVWMIGSDNA